MLRLPLERYFADLENVSFTALNIFTVIAGKKYKKIMNLKCPLWAHVRQNLWLQIRVLYLIHSSTLKATRCFISASLITETIKEPRTFRINVLDFLIYLNPVLSLLLPFLPPPSFMCAFINAPFVVSAPRYKRSKNARRVIMSATPNHLSPGLQTVEEISTPVSLPVSGDLPEYLNKSTLYRLGPGRYEAKLADGESYNIRHWFDGYALAHSFKFDTTKCSVAYRSKFTSESVIRAAESQTKAAHHPFEVSQQDPSMSSFERIRRFLSTPPVDSTTKENAVNINVSLQNIPGKGELVARTDASNSMVLDPDTLQPREFFASKDLGKGLSGMFSPAHGVYDERTGEFWNISYNITGPEATYTIFKVGKDGKGVVMGKVRDKSVFIHSFAMTENYMIVIVCPLQLNGIKLLRTRSLVDASSFQKQLKTRFHVMKRDGSGLVGIYESSSFFFFHNINAFEKNNTVHIDLCRFDDASILEQYQLNYMRTAKSFALAKPTRFTLEGISNLRSERPERIAKETLLHGMDIELICINPLFNFKDYTFVYGISTGGRRYMSEISKLNVKTGERIFWRIEDGTVGEPIFVPDPNGTSEDEGCVLVVVMLGNVQKSSLFVIDAKTMKEISRADVPQVIPLGFHGKHNGSAS